MAIIIKNGNLIDVNQGKLVRGIDILISKGKIQKIAKDITDKVDEIIDASGLLVSPGLIDMHVHLREPGFEDKETIFSGCRAAVAGGFTSIVCMPNTNPVIDNGGLISFIKDRAKSCVARVFPVGSITKGLQGEELAEIGDMSTAGAVAVSDDGRPVSDSIVMRRAMEYVKMFNIPVLSHCEDLALVEDGVMNEGYYSTILGLKGSPAQAESVMVARDVELAELTGVKLHIQHVSTKESVAIIKAAKKKGINVTAETAPHYIMLCDKEVITFDTNTKVNPPLRTKEDVKAIKDALADGTIDVIATDHAPHTEEEKDLEYNRAPFGINGLETALGSVLTVLLHNGKMDTVDIIKKLTINPSNILNLGKGVIEEGADADITIIDPDMEWVVDKEKFKSRSKNTPLHGKKLKGKAIATIVSGKVAFRNKDNV